jgi:hypothetical protein
VVRCSFRLPSLEMKSAPNVISATFRLFALDSEACASWTIDRPSGHTCAEPDVSDFNDQQQTVAPARRTEAIAHMPFNVMLRKIEIVEDGVSNTVSAKAGTTSRDAKAAQLKHEVCV